MSDGAMANGDAGAAPVSGAGTDTSVPTAATGAPAADNGSQAAVAAAPAAPAKAAASADPADRASQAASAALAAAQPAPARGKEAAPAAKGKKAENKRDDREDEGERKLAQVDEDKDLAGQIEDFFATEGQAAATPAAGAEAAAEDENDGGGISPILIGAGVLAAVGVGALVLGGGGGDKNDAPTATADTGAVNEGATLTGSVATNDSDKDGDTLTFAVVGTAPAGFTLNANGGYTFDANNAAYNSLAAGQTQQLVINYSVSDGKGGTAASTLTITVTGTNDAPVAVADTGPASTEGGAAVTGSVGTNDTDADQGAVLTYTLNAPVAGLTLNSNGTYSFDPSNAAYNSIAAGQTRTVVANYTVTDAQGATSTSTLTFVVTGTNDAPVAVADTAAGNEGGAALTGSVRTNDSDADDGAVLTYSLNAPVAGLTLNADGTYSFDLTNAAYDSIPAGETRNVVANYTVTDGQGATSTSTLTIAVTGANDAPVAGNDTATATEDGAVVTGSLTANDSDVDQGAVLTYSLQAPVAGLTVNSNGTFSFDPSDAAYNDLGAGETRQVTANVNVSDGQGGTATSVLTITVTGVNAAPVAADDTVTGDENVVITGSVSANDTDSDGDPLTFSLVGTAPAGFVLNADGSFSLDARNAAYRDLAAGETRDVTVTYQVADGQGGTDTGTLVVTVRGVNDAPVATDDTVAGNEDAVITGNIAANDTDLDGDTLTYSLVGTAPAGFVLNADGSFSLDARNAAYQDLGVGETRDVTVTYQVADGQGGTDTGTLTVTVQGVNDAPVAADDSDAGDEDTQIEGSVAANDADVDGDALTYTLVGTAPAGFVLNADGTYTLDTTDVAYQNLREGETLDVTVNYQVADANGGADTATLTIRVTGRIEQVNLDEDNDNNILTARVFDASATDFSFSDDDDVANTVVINGFGEDDFITFDAPFNGPGSVSFANIDADGDGLANDLSITTNKGGNVSDIVIRNVVDPNAVVFDEASAEAAVAGDDNFRTTTQVTIVNQSLDVDTDNNINTRFTVTPAANTATFVYSDDDDIANTVRVNDFGADDTLIFDSAIGDVSFASIDADGDGLANDLSITVNKNGTVSDIILANSVDPNSVIFDEASAEAAIGNGTDNFQFSGTVAPPPPPPPVGQTQQGLDQDNDNNLGTYRTFDAGTDGFTFTDDADTANSVQIINLGTNDRIVLEAGNSYSFANIDFDGDGLANDLQVTFNKGGTVSEIIIKDSVDPNAVVFNEATAEQALGNIDYFSFA